MGRSYAGALGLIAFATIVARGVIQQASASSTIPTAACALFVFAGLGYVLGRIAERAIDGDLKAHFVQEMERLKADQAGADNAA